MRLFAGIASAVFVAIGVLMIVDGTPYGWWVTGFFGLCLLIALFEHRLPTPWLDPEYRLVITDDQVACEHPRRKRETIAWRDVMRVWCVNTSAGLHHPDQWLLFEGNDGGCSVPTEAAGFEHIWDHLKQRFDGFDYGPLINRSGADAKQLCWERDRH